MSRHWGEEHSRECGLRGGQSGKGTGQALHGGLAVCWCRDLIINTNLLLEVPPCVGPSPSSLSFSAAFPRRQLLEQLCLPPP